jgi:hypothetical protein
MGCRHSLLLLVEQKDFFRAADFCRRGSTLIAVGCITGFKNLAGLDFTPGPGDRFFIVRGAAARAFACFAKIGMADSAVHSAGSNESGLVHDRQRIDADEMTRKKSDFLTRWKICIYKL